MNINLRKTVSLVIFLVCGFSLAAVSAYADTGTGIAKDIKVDIDGTYVEFSQEIGMPFVDSNYRTQVPLRACMEKLGCKVDWDNERQTAIVEKDGIVVEIPVGKYYIKKNGFEYMSDSAALLKDGRVYIPIRLPAEAFGAEVNWNQVTQTVIIASEDTKDGRVTVHFIDVGHGDAIFIDSGKYEILVDGGVVSNGGIISEYIRPYVDDKLDLVITTHGHMDHVGGLPEVFQNFPPTRIIESGSTVDTPEWRAYEEARNKLEETTVTDDEDEIIPIADGVTLQIIETMDDQELENNNSVISVLTVGNVKVLLTGDAQQEAEAVLAQKVGKMNVFKGGHHGSYNANSTELLSVIDPEYIVISAGKGVDYHHPHAAAMKRMIATDAVIYGTFKSGTVIMTTNGNSYSLEAADLTKNLIPLQLADAGTYQNNID